MSSTLNPWQGEFLVLGVVLGSLVVTIFRMVVGWRAMRAHESLGSANRQLADWYEAHYYDHARQPYYDYALRAPPSPWQP